MTIKKGDIVRLKPFKELRHGVNVNWDLEGGDVGVVEVVKPDENDPTDTYVSVVFPCRLNRDKILGARADGSVGWGFVPRELEVIE